jgi:hypothetical protein
MRPYACETTVAAKENVPAVSGEPGIKERENKGKEMKVKFIKMESTEI